jgi:TonB-dependent SusC/RagA subfamily outer membrane receptor
MAMLYYAIVQTTILSILRRGEKNLRVKLADCILLLNTNLKSVIMKSTALIAIIVVIASTVHSQTRVVSGQLTVFDTYPVQNVEISSKKAKATTTTDSLGQFYLVCQQEDVIKVKPKGFKPVQKKVHADTESVTMNLQFIDSEENRQMAVGYAYISEEDLTYGISHLENENHEFCSYSDIFELIRGQLSGVTVRGNEVYVRGGNNSFTPEANMALYVVDNQPTNSLDWLQPCQVKSINVLKDSNAAIYGTNGGNGVVLIETKK